MSFEKTGPRHWFVTIEKFHLTFGAFPTKKRAREFAERWIAE
jgi:hypothetical protein